MTADTPDIARQRAKVAALATRLRQDVHANGGFPDRHLARQHQDAVNYLTNLLATA